MDRVTTLNEFKYVKSVKVGGINPNNPISDDQRKEQFKELNYLLETGKGVIIGKDISFGTYKFGEHQLTLEAVSYHIGFKRKPYFIDD